MLSVKNVKMFLVTLLLCFFLVGCEDSSSDNSSVWLPGGSVTTAPSSLDFGKVKQGESKTLTVTLTNGSSAAVKIAEDGGQHAIVIAGSTLLTTSDNCGTITANSSCEIKITFSPIVMPTDVPLGAMLIVGLSTEEALTVQITGNGIK